MGSSISIPEHSSSEDSTMNNTTEVTEISQLEVTNMSSSSSSSSSSPISSLPVELLERIAFFLTPNLQDPAVFGTNAPYQHEIWKKRCHYRKVWAAEANDCRAFRLTCARFSLLTTPLKTLFHTVNLRLVRADMTRILAMTRHPRIAASVRNVIMRSGVYLDGMTRTSEVLDWNDLCWNSPQQQQIQASIESCRIGFERQESGFRDGTFRSAWIEALRAFSNINNISVDFSSDEREWHRLHAIEPMLLHPDDILYAPRSKIETSLDHFLDFTYEVVQCSNLAPSKIVLGESGWEESWHNSSSKSLLAPVPLFDCSRLQNLDMHICRADDVHQSLDVPVMQILQNAKKLESLCLHKAWPNDSSLDNVLQEIDLPELKNLSLLDVKFRSDALLDLLNKHPKLSSLNLRGCTLTNESPREWAKIFRGMRAQPSIRRIELVEMQLGIVSLDPWCHDENQGLNTVWSDSRRDSACDMCSPEVRMLNEYLNHAGLWTKELGARWDGERQEQRIGYSFW